MGRDGFIVRPESRQNRVQFVAFVISVFLCVLLCICFLISTQNGLEESSEIELDGRINPNEATVTSLVRLPGIGVVRAEAIVAYRGNFSRQGADRPAFESVDDLQKVKGIGPKTAENISEWLKFE